MKNYIFLSLLILFIANTSFANDKSYDLIIKKYNSGDMSEITAHANGLIDGVEHVAVISEQASPTYGGPVILLYQKTQDRFEMVAKIDLQGDHAAEYDLSIKHNSIFLEHLVGHHGWDGSRYQFKKVENKFRMIGIETRSETLGCYAGDESPKCDKYEVWSGTSYNLFTSSAICWRTTFSFRNEQKIKDEVKNKNYWHKPKDATQHQMSFQRVTLPWLDKFDLFDFYPPKSCYFDHNNRLQLEP